MKLRPMRKDAVLEVMNTLPAEFEMEELLERIILMSKVEEGLEQLESGRTVEHSKVVEEVKRW